MIGHVTRGQGFGGLAAYLLTGRDGNTPERVAWSATRNLPTPDNDLAAPVMAATASQNPRVEKPVYHLSISLDPGEKLTPQQLEKVADRTLKDLGLDQHQTLMVAHNDTDHQHVHLMINRVHPERLKAWRPEFDYARIEQSLRQQERELGLREVPGRHAPLERQNRYVGPYSIPESKRVFTEKVVELVRQDFRQAKSWDELHRGLADMGLKLEKRGRGLSVTDGEQRAKASDIDRKSSLKGLESRLGIWQPPTPEKVVEHRVEPGRFGDIQELKQVADDLVTTRRAEQAQDQAIADKRFEADFAKREHERAVSQEQGASQKLDSWLAKVYREPEVVRQIIDSVAKRSETEVAKVRDLLQRKPEALGKLHGRGRLFANKERWAAKDAARNLHHLAKDWISKWRGLSQKVKPLMPSPEADVAPPARQSLRLERSASGLVQRLGWKLAYKVLPAPQLRVLGLVLKATRKLRRVMDQGLDR